MLAATGRHLSCSFACCVHMAATIGITAYFGVVHHLSLIEIRQHSPHASGCGATIAWLLGAYRRLSGFHRSVKGPASCAGGVRLCRQAPGEVVPALLKPCSRAQCCFFAELLLMLNAACCCCSKSLGFVSPRTQDCHTGARKVWGAAATQGQLVVSGLPPSFCQFVLIVLLSADVQSAGDVWRCYIRCST